MKKWIVFSAALTAVLLSVCVCITPVRALFFEITEPEQVNLHTAKTHTAFLITEEGLARVCVDYLGYESAAGGSVRVTIRSERDSVVDRTYDIEGNLHFEVYEYPLYETGRYHCTVVYTIRGNTAGTDVITFEGDAECLIPAVVPEVHLPTEQVLLDQNGKLCEKLLIEHGKNGERLRDAVYDAGGNKIAEFLYHTKTPYNASLDAYYALGTLHEIKQHEIPPATASFTVWDSGGRKVMSGYGVYLEDNRVHLTVNDGNDGFLLSESREYDADGRVTLVIGYDAEGNTIRTSSYEYGTESYVCIYKDGETTVYETYGNDGALQKKETVNADGLLASETVYQYDEATETLRPSSVTDFFYTPDGEREHVLTYDGEHRLLGRTDYEGGLVLTETSYLRNGEVSQKTLYEYDTEKKLSKKTCYRDGSLFAVWYPLKNSELLYVEHGEHGIVELAQYRSRDNILTEQIRFDHESSRYEYSTFRYDERGRMIEENIEVLYGFGGHFHEDISALYAYDVSYVPYISVGQDLSQTHESTRRYRYDTDDRLTEMSIYEQGALCYVEGYAYREDGTVLKKTVSQYQSERLRSEVVTDFAADGRTPTRQTTYNRGRSILSRTYYRADGIPEITTSYEGEIPTQEKRYEYTEDGVFLSATLTDAYGMFLSRTQYAYDEYGRLSLAEHINWQGVTVNGVSFTYDDAGRRLSKTTRVLQTVTELSGDGTPITGQKNMTYREIYAYDEKGQLTDLTESINANVVRHTCYQYYATGTLARTVVTTAKGKLSTDYDRYGIVVKETMTVDSLRDPDYFYESIPRYNDFRCDYRDRCSE
ncbi:MAG: RHS repeat protein [Clostridia bacterium]|nr:RHS repeat protein [Clostridia bacterium]